MRIRKNGNLTNEKSNSRERLFSFMPSGEVVVDSRGGDQGGLGVRSPKNLRWEGRLMHWSPQGSYTTFNTVKKRKIWKTWPMTKKRSSEIFRVKMLIFSGKNVIQVRENLFVPPNSAPGLRRWWTGNSARIQILN